MAYRALYREWRPKDFSHVVGQNAIIETLRNQVITKRIAHAYLFCGSRGTGKTSTAKILAKAINCLNPKNGDPCGECENCIRADKEETLDMIEIDAASNNGVDEMRELRDTVKYPPQYGTYKVYIIDEVHMLSTSAFNALLKTLEEPPAHIVFILATTEPQKLPETILSRCQRFDFGRISVTDITGRLKEASLSAGAEVSDGALMMIARTAEGGMRDALSILDMCLGYSDKVDESLVRNILGTSDAAFLFEFCSAMAERDAGTVFSMIDHLMREGKDPSVFAKDLCRHVRALLIGKTSADDLAKIMDVTDEEAEEYIHQSENITVTRLIRILDLFMALETEMRYSSTPRLALENTAIKCCLRIEDADNQALMDRIEELEKQIEILNKKTSSAAISAVTDEKETTARKRVTDSTVKGNSSVSDNSRKMISNDGKSVWNELMTRIQKKDIKVWSFLSQGNLVNCAEQHYHWRATLQEGEMQYIAALNKPETNQTICGILKDITGCECAFSADRHDKLHTDVGNDDAYLATIYETFGREPVDVVDKIK